MTPKPESMLETVPKPLLDEHADDLACYLLRIGIHGHIGRFRSSDASVYRRSDRVITRTVRGVEVGQVLGLAHPTQHPVDLADGRILRKMSTQDEILWGHLSELAAKARDDCQRWLDEQRVDGLLIDVEPLLDGKTLYFHFLSEVAPEIQTYLDDLVAVYERSVRSSQFAQLLEHGCGPGCGTEQAKNGCGSRGGCAVCRVAGQCKK